MVTSLSLFVSQLEWYKTCKPPSKTSLRRTRISRDMSAVHRLRLQQEGCTTPETENQRKESNSPKTLREVNFDTLAKLSASSFTTVIQPRYTDGKKRGDDSLFDVQWKHPYSRLQPALTQPPCLDRNLARSISYTRDPAISPDINELIGPELKDFSLSGDTRTGIMGRMFKTTQTQLRDVEISTENDLTEKVSPLTEHSGPRDSKPSEDSLHKNIPTMLSKTDGSEIATGAGDSEIQDLYPSMNDVLKSLEQIQDIENKEDRVKESSNANALQEGTQKAPQHVCLKDVYVPSGNLKQKTNQDNMVVVFGVQGTSARLHVTRTDSQRDPLEVTNTPSFKKTQQQTRSNGVQASYKEVIGNVCDPIMSDNSGEPHTASPQPEPHCSTVLQGGSNSSKQSDRGVRFGSVSLETDSSSECDTESISLNVVRHPPTFRSVDTCVTGSLSTHLPLSIAMQTRSVDPREAWQIVERSNPHLVLPRIPCPPPKQHYITKSLSHEEPVVHPSSNPGFLKRCEKRRPSTTIPWLRPKSRSGTVPCRGGYRFALVAQRRERSMRASYM